MCIRDSNQTGRKPKAIVPVALYGMPYKTEQIMSVADKYDIPVIEDAAEGFGKMCIRDRQKCGRFLLAFLLIC